MPHAFGMAGQVIHTMVIEFGHVCCLRSAGNHGLFFSLMLMVCCWFHAHDLWLFCRSPEVLFMTEMLPHYRAVYTLLDLFL